MDRFPEDRVILVMGFDGPHIRSSDLINGHTYPTFKLSDIVLLAKIVAIE